MAKMTDEERAAFAARMKAAKAAKAAEAPPADEIGPETAPEEIEAELEGEPIRNCVVANPVQAMVILRAFFCGYAEAEGHCATHLGNGLVEFWAHIRPDQDMVKSLVRIPETLVFPLDGVEQPEAAMESVQEPEAAE